MTEATLSKGQRTRRAIMDSARTIILEQGYTAASMRKIGEGAGITPAAIYNHFESKEALFSALLEEAVPFAEVTTFLRGVQADSAERLLEKAFRGLVAIFEAHDDYVRLALIDAQEREGATLVRFLPHFFPLMVGFVQRLQALDGGQRRLRPLPPHIIARALVSMLGGYVLTERVARLERLGALQAPVLPQADWQSGLLDVLMFGLFREQAPEEEG